MKNLTIISYLFLLFGFPKNLHCQLIKEKIKTALELANIEKLSYDQKLKFNKTAFLLLSKSSNDSISLIQLMELNKNYYDLNSFDNLKKASCFFLQRSIAFNSKYFIAQSNRWIGIYYESASENDSAFKYYLKAERLFKSLNDDKNLCHIYHDKAKIQRLVNDYLGSEQSLVNALKIANKLSIDDELFGIYLDLGLNCNEQRQYEKAFEYYKKALFFAEKNKKIFREDVSFCLNNIGVNFFDIKDYKSAIVTYKEALSEKNLESESPLIFCRLLDNLGRAKLKLKQYNGIIELHDKASKIYDSLKNKYGVTANKLFISEYYLAVRDTIMAIKYAKSAFCLSNRFKLPNETQLCLLQLSKTDTKNALKYVVEYIKISDSMQLLERTSRNKFAKIAYETEEITNEKEAAIQQKHIFLGITIFIFAAGVMLFIIAAQRVKQKEMQFLQEQQRTDEETYQLIQTQQIKIDEGREIEKKRIAQDLHDGIMNRLASTRLNLHILNEKSDTLTIKKCIPFINGIQNIEKEIRNIAHDLNKDVFVNTDSFLAVVDSLFEEQKKLFKTKCHLEIEKKINWDDIESSKKIHIYRIMQEALNNINKHAKANNIVASILDHDKYLLMEVFDDGIGFSVNRKKKGIGLQNIYARTKALKGIIEIKSFKEIGTTLIITIPKKL